MGRYAVEYEEGLLISKEWSRLDGRGTVLTPAQVEKQDQQTWMDA
jgi:hypothetical protein